MNLAPSLDPVDPPVSISALAVVRAETKANNKYQGHKYIAPFHLLLVFDNLNGLKICEKCTCRIHAPFTPGGKLAHVAAEAAVIPLQN